METTHTEDAMTTTITPTDTACDRCDHDLTETVTRYMDEGGPGQCPRCDMPAEPSAEWLTANGYEADRFTLVWTSADGQGSMPMGEYPTRGAAMRAIPEAKAEALAECADDVEREGIEAGSWTVGLTED